MLIQPENGTLIWVMAYVYPTVDFDVLYCAYKCFEVFLYIPSLFMTIAFCRLALKVRMFHPNMTFIIVAFIGQWVECFIAQICILPYSEGLINLQDANNGLSAPGYEMIKQVHSTWDSLPLILGGFLRAQYAYSVIICTTVVVVERSIATFWLRDYEKHSRVYISVTLLVLTHVLSCMISILAMSHSLTSLELLTGPIALNALSFLWYFVLLWYNTQVQHKLNKSHRTFTYSLAARFQAKENIRTLKLARNVFFVCVVVVVVNTTLVAGIIYELFPDSMKPYLLILNYSLINLCPLYIVPTMVLSIAEWKKAVVDRLPMALRPHWLTAVRPHEYSLKPKEEADAYWKQFDKDWRQF